MEEKRARGEERADFSGQSTGRDRQALQRQSCRATLAPRACLVYYRDSPEALERKARPGRNGFLVRGVRRKTIVLANQAW